MLRATILLLVSAASLAAAQGVYRNTYTYHNVDCTGGVLLFATDVIDNTTVFCDPVSCADGVLVTCTPTFSYPNGLFLAQQVNFNATTCGQGLVSTYAIAASSQCIRVGENAYHKVNCHISPVTFEICSDSSCDSCSQTVFVNTGCVDGTDSFCVLDDDVFTPTSPPPSTEAPTTAAPTTAAPTEEPTVVPSSASAFGASLFAIVAGAVATALYSA